MLDARGFRQLLIADLAVVRGVASARDVALAFQEFWRRRTRAEVSVAEEIGRVAGLPPKAFEPIEAEADRLIEEAGGDAWVALTRKGGLNPSIHLALGKSAPEVSVALTRVDAGARAPLRTVPADRYEAFEVAGEGGMGVVYVAVDTEMNRRVALKMVRPDVGSHGSHTTPATPMSATRPEDDADANQAFNELKARFLQEAWITGGLEHPGVVPVHELGQTPHGIPYYTMRFVRGKRTLAEAIDDLAGAPVTDRLALLEPFLKLCDTVRYAHSKGVVHRDLKPTNVALGEFGEVILLDWGLAKLAGQSDDAAHRWQERVRDLRAATDLETAFSAVGTPGYMSPEAALGRLAEVDEQSDVYSLGVILYRILTGSQPFAFTSYAEYVDQLGREEPAAARSVAPGVARDLSDLCAQCLARDRAKRPADVEALAAALRAWQTASVVDREVDGLLRDARAALAGAEESQGQTRLQQVERAVVALARVAKRRPDDETAATLGRRADALRERGIGERGRAARRRLLLRLGSAALVLIAVAGFLVAAEISRERAEAERRLLESLEESGRTLLLAGHPLRAAPYLAAAYERGKQDPVLRLLLREACRPLDAQLATFEHPGETPASVSSLAISPDGGLLAATYWDQVVRLCDPRSGTQVRVIQGHTGNVRCAAFSPDGARLATASSDRSVGLWDVETGRALRSFRGHESSVLSVTWSPDGETLASAEWDGTARLWDVGTGMERWAIDHPAEVIHGVGFRPRGSSLSAVGNAPVVWLWDLDTRKRERVLEGHTNRVTDTDFSPDGRLLASASEDRTARIWDLDTGKVLRTLEGHTDAVTSIAFSPDGRTIASGSCDLSIRLWEASTGRCLGALHGHSGNVGSLAWDPAGARLYSGSGDTSIKVWDASTGRDDARLEGHTDLVQTAAFNPDGSRIVTTSSDGTAKLWETGTLRELHTLAGHAGAVSGAAFSPGGECVATCGADGTVRLWDSATGRERTVLAGHGDHVWSVAWSPNGKVLASAHYGGFTRLWDTESGRETLTIEGSKHVSFGGQFAVAFSPDGRMLATGGRDFTVRLYDVATGREQALLEGHMAPVYSVAFSGDGSKLLTASQDRMAKLWSLETRREIATFEGHTFHVWSAEFSPDETMIVTASYDGTVRMWDVATGRELTTITGHADTHRRDVDHAVTAVFSPDGRQVLATGSANQAKLCTIQRETRTPDEITDLLRERCPYRLVEGRLVKALYERPE